MALSMMSHVPFWFHLVSHRRNSSKSSYIRYKWSKFHCDWPIIKTLYGGQQCMILPVSQSPLEEFSWKFISGRLPTLATNIVSVLVVEMMHQMHLRCLPTHNYNRTLDDRVCYMVIAASVQTLRTYMNTMVCGDTCLNAYNGVSGCPLLI